MFNKFSSAFCLSSFVPGLFYFPFYFIIRLLSHLLLLKSGCSYTFQSRFFLSNVNCCQVSIYKVIRVNVLIKFNVKSLFQSPQVKISMEKTPPHRFSFLNQSTMFRHCITYQCRRVCCMLSALALPCLCCLFQPHCQKGWNLYTE